MADHLHHHHQHRPQRLSVPLRATASATFSTTPRPYPMYPYTSSTPTPTPSKHRLSSVSSFNSQSSDKSSLSFLFLLLLSLRSFYSLLPFLRSSPSFSLFPFSFLVSLLSFLLTLCFSLFSSYSSSSTSRDPFGQKKANQPIFALNSITQSQQKLLVAKSVLLALVFLLRFQALRYCGTAAMILAELTGTVAARFAAEGGNQIRRRSPKVRGFLALSIGLFLLSFSWDRVDCLPFSTTFADKRRYALFARENCVRIWPMLLPFLSGFLGCYERKSMDWGTIKQLGLQRVRLISLFFTTIVLFVPAVISFLLFETEEESVSFTELAWPLVNTVVFGVLLSENYSNEKIVRSEDSQREFLVTFACTVVLELFYFPELSLWGLLLCGFLLYIAVRDLDPLRLNHHGTGEVYSDSFTGMIMKPIRHILSERKSRKIALFLFINACYMVVEFVGGFMSNSLGLISDACHMLFDCAALAIGLYASYISRLPANHQYNYGRGRFEVLSGYANAVFLVLVGALIVLESFERILDPQEISTNSLLVVSIGGLVVNVIGLIFFHEEHHHAHGGSGSCSHSHAHSHSHHDHHHHHDLHCHGEHNNEAHGMHGDIISVSSDHQGNLCSRGHDRHPHDHIPCSHHKKVDSNAEDHIAQSPMGHNHQCHHENRGHDQQHVNHNHSDHHHDHDSEQHHHYSHDGHACHQDNHGHGDHHDHDNHHHHHDADHHVHKNSLKFDAFTKSHSEGVCSSVGNCDSKLINASTDDAKKLQAHGHFHIDHNMEGIFLHVLADTMGSVGVVISTLLIKYKGWLIADPACSIFISILIVSSVIPLLRNSAEILLQRVPKAHEKELKDALKDVLKIRGVCGIERFNVWSFTNTDVVGTLHLHLSTDADKASVKSQVSNKLHDAGVKDLTLQVEYVG
ncbi:probable zinc transporter protein DDB_G0291141 [Neltuma alba]|uniref:probable zinc transporter protein DDB_G0291141 n=1 Tax=Neltuma alba TaxID=207710 RepID=UPI0010A4EE85|nr:probable zinc transporter protein DDB_G0291141 [Prosopis alba]